MGLLYDSSALDAAWDLVRHWSAEDRRLLALNVPEQGLGAQVAGRSVLDIAQQVAQMAQSGLKNRAMAGKVSADETEYLDPVLEWLDAGQSPADRLIAKFEGEWAGDIHRVFKEEAY